MINLPEPDPPEKYFQFIRSPDAELWWLYMRQDLSGVIKNSMASLFILKILELFQSYLDLDIQTGII